MAQYPALIQLQEAVLACRAEAKSSPKSDCHEVVKWECAGDCIPMITGPLGDALDYPVEILTVGINPKWTDHPSETYGRAPLGEINGPKTFDAYKRTILSGLPEGTGEAHVELVQCGTPGGGDVKDVIALCRGRFFDKVIAELRPKVIIPMGQWASANLYWFNTAAGKSGARWEGMRKRHATSEIVSIAGHECPAVFVLQPSAYVSMEERLAARDEIARAYASAR